MHKVFYAESATQDLERLEKRNVERITKKVEFYAQQENPISFAKPLKGKEVGKYRFRIGDYRAIFHVDAKGQILILMILRIKHRKDVYDL